RSLHRRENPNNSLLRRPEMMTEQSARLAHLCRLIVRDRHPYCPANGILLLLPLSGTDNDQDAADTGVVCQKDLTTVRAVLRVQCPVIGLLCDLETMPGFNELTKRFSSRERLNRVGQRAPLVPDFLQIAPARGESRPLGALLDSLVGWVCHQVMPAWVYK